MAEDALFSIRGLLLHYYFCFDSFGFLPLCLHLLGHAFVHIVDGFSSLFTYTYIEFSSPDTWMTSELSDTRN